MQGNNILGFPPNKIVRKFENQTVPKPSNDTDIETLTNAIMDSIDGVLDKSSVGDVVDDSAFKEYCLIQQAVLSMAKKIYDETDDLQEFADYYIEICSEDSEGQVTYNAKLPSLAFLEEDGGSYTIVSFEENV